MNFPVALVVKNLLANAVDARDGSLIPKSRRSSGEGNDNPLQYSCLENPMNREAWWATVHWSQESDTTEATEHTHIECIISRVNPNVNYELSVITVYQCRFINCKKYTISVEDKNREAMHICG